MTNNNILIGHLGWDGCHFLGSCLTMSDEVYFNNCTLRGKIEYYHKSMSDISWVNGEPVWSDVFMFFGTSYQTDGYIHYRHAWNNDSESNLEQFPSDSRSKQQTIISRLHVPIYYELGNMLKKNISHPVMDMFKCKYFICLVNTHLFSSLRSIKIENSDVIDDSWDDGFAKIPDMKWFNGPLTEVDKITNSVNVSQFQLLPKEVQEHIRSYHKSDLDGLFNLTKLYKSDNDILKSMITHQWDCDWFLNEDDTVDGVKFLYSEMNLGKFNENLIRKMYKIWIRKIDYIKTWYVKNESSINNEMEVKYDRCTDMTPLNKEMFMR
jgi:hypothetical protein